MIGIARVRPKMSSILADHLIVFTRFPQPGSTKTRLIPALGAQGAAAMQRCMTENLMAWVKHLCRERPVSVEIRYAGSENGHLRHWLGEDYLYAPQAAGDLGQRMQQAMTEAQRAGARRTILVGSDIPGLTSAVMHRAFDLLHKRPLVFGPALDGGYYLVGMDCSVDQAQSQAVFENMVWSRADVLQKTLQKAVLAGLKWHLVDRLGDVDEPRDLGRWIERPCWTPADSALPLISVIIPTLDEAGNLPQTVARLRHTLPVEIIVVDGGSQDKTLATAIAMGLNTQTTELSRGGQMNHGARSARGDILLFLHADTHLPLDWPMQVHQAYTTSRFGAGAFRLQIDAAGGSIRMVEKIANWRSCWLGMPYGDQALFTSREVFARMGGFGPLPIMEDFDFVKRVRHHGRVIILTSSARTSARRWRRLGVIKTTLINLIVVSGFFLGMAPARLARLYRGPDPKVLQAR